MKQAGNGISRYHTWGWRIAQGLQSVKYFLQYPKNPKRDRTGYTGDHLGFFNILLKGKDPLEALKIFQKKNESKFRKKLFS